MSYGKARIDQIQSSTKTVNVDDLLTNAAGSVTSTQIADGTITNADINASAAIADTKLATISTAGKVNGTALTGSIPGAVLSNSQTFVGTTAINLNRTSANQGLTGISSVALPGATSGTITVTPAAVAGTTAITVPATSGTLVTTGDTGTVTSTMVADGTLVNADINASAAIAGTKISPDFGSQNTTTTGTSTAASFIPSSSTAPTNGVYLPAANSVGIATNGSNRLHIDSTGKVGIGTTSFSAVSEISAAKLQGVGGVIVGNDGASGNGSGWIAFDSACTAPTSAKPVIYHRQNVGLGVRSDYEISFEIGSSDAVKIDSSRRLLLGTSSTSSTAGLIVQGAGGAAPGIIRACYTTATPANGDTFGYLVFGDSAHSDAAWVAAARDGGTWSGSSKPTRLVFGTTPDSGSSPVERMRIGWDGNVLINTTTNLINENFKLQVKNSVVAAIFKNEPASATTETVCIWNSTTAGDSRFILFDTEGGTGTARGNIDYNRAAGQVRYNATSDQRLKSNIQDSNSAINLLSNIRVRSYTWTETGYKIDHGFIAQELYQAVPDAVRVGDSGEEINDIWAVDNAKVVPLLTKALQEALAKIETLEARLTAAGI